MPDRAEGFRSQCHNSTLGSRRPLARRREPPLKPASAASLALSVALSEFIVSIVSTVSERETTGHNGPKRLRSKPSMTT